MSSGRVARRLTSSVTPVALVAHYNHAVGLERRLVDVLAVELRRMSQGSP